mgnify:FL=1
MQKLALSLPQFGSIDNPPGLVFSGSSGNLGSVLSSLFEIAFFIAAFLAFFWLVWGAFQYIYAGGNKENLAKARSRITWAIVGLLLVAVAYIVSQFAQQILQPRTGTPILFVSPAYAAVDIGGEFAFGDIQTLGEGVTRLVTPTFSLATVSVVIYFLIGAFKYLISGGDKEAVAGARGMMTHALIGFAILMFAFLILDVLFGIFGIQFSLF